MLGQRIRALRREQGLSQAELADRLGISASTMGMYEQGRREPALAMVICLARELNVTTDFLLTGRISEVMDEENYARLIRFLIDEADRQLQHRQGKTLSRKELALLFAALLTEP